MNDDDNDGQAGFLSKFVLSFEISIIHRNKILNFRLFVYCIFFLFHRNSKRSSPNDHKRLKSNHGSKVANDDNENENSHADVPGWRFNFKYCNATNVYEKVSFEQNEMISR